MILCHKCSGILANVDSEDVSGLSGCGCISGWVALARLANQMALSGRGEKVRGFEPNVPRDVAIRSQITQCFQRADLYTQQGRANDWIDPLYAKAETLMNLL